MKAIPYGTGARPYTYGLKHSCLWGKIEKARPNETRHADEYHVKEFDSRYRHYRLAFRTPNRKSDRLMTMRLTNLTT